MNPRKTYWHLTNLQKRPDEYDIGTANLLHDDGRVFETDVPVLPWYREHARESFLYKEKLEQFEDPRRVTYRRYTEVQAAKEHFVDGLFSAIDATEYDRGLSESWIGVLDRVLPVLRYPVHGLQMASAYVAHLAPNGKLVVVGVFQCGDELRRLQCLARRMHQLSLRTPDFGRHAREQWQDAPAWQPLRKLIEELLVTYDWSEALIALQLVVKPMFDRLFMHGLARSAERAGDPLFGKLLFSLATDGDHQREATRALFAMLFENRPELRARVQAHLTQWATPTRAALHALLPLIDWEGTRAASYAEDLDEFCESYWSSIGCSAGGNDGGSDDTRAGAETA
ncbi:MAG TPA: hypothetical protein VHM19_14180 [Polyangiales bacterium]|jgi:toluene monooxygenase system protein E|nr:hypothetical protein [Polyangiales bacterium]